MKWMGAMTYLAVGPPQASMKLSPPHRSPTLPRRGPPHHHPYPPRCRRCSPPPRRCSPPPRRCSPIREAGTASMAGTADSPAQAR